MVPFDQGMGGITYNLRSGTRTAPVPVKPTYHEQPQPLVVFIKYGNFKMLFPGDGSAGWLELLKRDFRPSWLVPTC